MDFSCFGYHPDLEITTHVQEKRVLRELSSRFIVGAVDADLAANCSHQSGNNTQIVAQEANNPVSESQTNTSSRVIVQFCQMTLVWPRVRYSAVLMGYLNSRTQSCYCAPAICVLRPSKRQIEHVCRAALIADGRSIEQNRVALADTHPTVLPN